jgi:F-type H+-transporting ATPase subunit epsilon
MAEATQIELAVVTPERAVIEEIVDHVVLTGSEGEMDILPGHIPLLSAIGVGRMETFQGGQSKIYSLARGFVEVLPDRVTILTEDCEGVDDIDIEDTLALLREAELELERIERTMAERDLSHESPEEEARRLHEESIVRARNRLLLMFHAAKHSMPGGVFLSDEPTDGVVAELRTV